MLPDNETLTQMQARSLDGDIDALRALADLSMSPNPWGYGPAQAYRFCLIAAYLGDAHSRSRAVDLLDHLPVQLQEAVFDEVEDWLEERLAVDGASPTAVPDPRQLQAGVPSPLLH